MKNTLSNVMQMQGVTYDWKVKEFPDKHFTNDQQVGFIAQELEQVYPEIVFADNDGYKSVDYSKLTPVLVEAIKEQQKIIDSQKKEIEGMKNDMTSFKEMLKTLQLQINSSITSEAKK